MEPIRPIRSTAFLSLYEGVAGYPGPVIARWAASRRVARGKEDPGRVGERFGRASAPRPPGPLAWLHGASVGESLSLLPLIEAMRAARPDVTLLVTTHTKTAGAMMSERLPAGALHQYVPYDTAPAAAAFLDYWRPDVMAVVESELWPVLLRSAKRRGVRLALLSARMSERSAGKWGYVPRSAAALLGLFDVILAQNESVETRLLGLGAARDGLRVGGALKDAAGALPVAQDALSEWRRRLAGRPVWLAASTHPGEETAALAAHAALKDRFPRLLTVIAPRHPDRGDAVAAEIAAAGAPVARWSAGDPPPEQAGVMLVDALGQLGLWYRLAPVAFVGGSLGDEGGHNPLEPARLGAAVLFGPGMANFEADRRRLFAAEAAREVTAETLAETVAALLAPGGGATPEAAALGERAQAAAGPDRRAVEAHLSALLPLLPAARGDAG